MLDVIIPLLDVELGPVLFPFEINLLQVQKMLIIKNINCFDFILNHFLLIIFQHFSPQILQIV